jgi:hypothetical protein
VLEQVRFLVTERELWAGARRSFAIALILQLAGSASEVLFEISAAPIVLGREDASHPKTNTVSTRDGEISSAKRSGAMNSAFKFCDVLHQVEYRIYQSLSTVRVRSTTPNSYSSHGWGPVPTEDVR